MVFRFDARNGSYYWPDPYQPATGAAVGVGVQPSFDANPKYQHWLNNSIEPDTATHRPHSLRRHLLFFPSIDCELKLKWSNYYYRNPCSGFWSLQFAWMQRQSVLLPLTGEGADRRMRVDQISMPRRTCSRIFSNRKKICVPKPQHSKTKML